MMVSVETYLRRRQRQLRQWMRLSETAPFLRAICCGLGGFFLSAANLGASPQPFAMGLCCAAPGWQAVAAALGSIAGYLMFWGGAGVQGILWAGAGCIMALLIRKAELQREMPLLIPSLAAFWVSVTGLCFQLLCLDESPFWVYVLRVAIAGGSVMLFDRLFLQRDAVSRWSCGSIFVLALSRISPFPWLNLGSAACGFFASGVPLSGAALAGLGMDLAQVTAVPMTAAVCLSVFLRLVLPKSVLLHWLCPGMVYLSIALLFGSWEFFPIPGLLLGSGLGLALGTAATPSPRQGRTGHAQVQLELTAGVLAQTQQLLLEAPATPIDEAALLEKAIQRSCSNCVLRLECRERENLSVYHLHHPLDFACRKPGRILGELRRGREQMLSLRREKERNQEYHWALAQQYQFLSEYIQSVADSLSRQEKPPAPRYRIQVSARSRGKQRISGDSCIAFPGSNCHYYVILCDGMGTGMGAAQEGRGAAALLKTMLTAGMSPEQALHSINGILALRGQAGMVTMDLAEVSLATGKLLLYKWGAAPSWLLREQQIEPIGYATAPPGISVKCSAQTVQRLTLAHGEKLILLSDGADIQESILRGKIHWGMEPGMLAQTILKCSRTRGEDDATAAVMCLTRISTDAPERETEKPE